MRRILICAMFASAVAVGPAAAEEVGDDARCLFVAMVGLGQATAPEQKGQLASAAMFFMGRLDRASSEVDLVDKIRSEARGLRSPQELGSEARRCSDIVKRRGETLREIGQKLNDKSE